MVQTLSARGLAWTCFTAIGLLILGHLGALALSALGYSYAFGLIKLFHFSYEMNAPTLFNSVLLLLAGGLLAVHARIDTRFRWRWALAALVALIMGVDEIAALHEPIMFVLGGGVSDTTVHVREAVTARWADLAPYLVIGVGILLAYYWPLLRRLRGQVLGMAAVGIVTYLVGALVLDTVTGKNLGLIQEGFLYHLLITLEEPLEMCGVVFAMVALMRNLELEHPGLSFVIGGQER